MMGGRRASRVRAMQALFIWIWTGTFPVKCLSTTVTISVLRRRRFLFTKLVKGVIAAKPEIDAIIKRFSSNWKMSRMSGVDRNILRIAVYELLFCDDIPPKVTINEAIDVGKKFGAEESGAFINGILDSVRIELEKKNVCFKT